MVLDKTMDSNGPNDASRCREQADQNRHEDALADKVADVEERRSAPPAHEVTSTSRAAVMYTLSLTFLGLLAGMLPHGGAADQISEVVLGKTWVRWVLALNWLIIIVEAGWGFRAASDKLKPALLRLLLVCLMPPFRMMIAPAIPNRYIWLPRQGWLRTGQEQLERMEWRTPCPCC